MKSLWATPNKIIWRQGKLLLRYFPSKKSHGQPLLAIFALVNRPYILDLYPQRSVIESLNKGGLDVYLIDWGVPDRSDQFNGLEDYVGAMIPDCARQVQSHCGETKISVLGYCMGGTMALMYASLFPQEIKKLILMAAPVDFHEGDGLLGAWSSKEILSAHEMVQIYGNIPPWMLEWGFQWMKPLENMFDKHVQRYINRGNKELMAFFKVMERWIHDGVPVPGVVFEEFVRECYQNNSLIKDGLKIGESKVFLKNIACPILNLMARHDHLVPPVSSRSLEKVLGKRVTSWEFPAGHIGLAVGAKAHRELWPKVARWIFSDL